MSRSTMALNRTNIRWFLFQFKKKTIFLIVKKLINPISIVFFLTFQLKRPLFPTSIRCHIVWSVSAVARWLRAIHFHGFRVIPPLPAPHSVHNNLTFGKMNKNIYIFLINFRLIPRMTGYFFPSSISTRPLTSRIVFAFFRLTFRIFPLI